VSIGTSASCPRLRRNRLYKRKDEGSAAIGTGRASNVLLITLRPLLKFRSAQYVPAHTCMWNVDLDTLTGDRGR
jgi:hypothetical protein